MTTLASNNSLFLSFGDGSSGGGGGSTIVINDLNSTSTTAALSANMGRTIRIMIEGVIADLNAHIATNASENTYGHVKIDNDTIKVNASGQIYSTSSSNVELHHVVDDTDDKAVTPLAVKQYIENLSNELVKEEFVFTGLTGNPIVIEFTPTIVDDNFISIVFQNTIKALPDAYTVNPKDSNDLSKGYVLTYNGNVGIINLVLISGHAIGGGSGGNVDLHHVVDNTDDKAVTPLAVKEYIDDISSSLKKEEIIVLPTSAQSEFTFTPQIVSVPFIEMVFINTTKLKPDTYVMNDNGDGSFTIVLDNHINNGNLFNATLISGLAVSGNVNGSVSSVNGYSPDNSGNVEIPTATKTVEGVTTLTNTIDNSENKSVTPKGVMDYVAQVIADLTTSLNSISIRVNVPSGSASLPINITGYSPSTHTIFLFDNTTKVFGDSYTISTSATSTSGYEVLFNTPPVNIASINYEIVALRGIIES